MPIRHANPEIDGAKLREVRQHAGLTVTEAAAKIGVTAGYLSSIERGHRRTVAPARFNLICEVYGITDRSKLQRKAAA